MLKNIDCVLIWTDNVERLAKFYEEKLGLEIDAKLNHPQDTGTLYKFPNGGPQFWIGLHSEVKGQNRDSARHMINFLVDNVDEEYKNLKEKGVQFIADPFSGPTGNGRFATFKDPDGNLLQLWSK